MKQARTLGRKPHGLSFLLAGGLVLAAVMLFVPSAGATSIVQQQSPAYLRSHGAAVQVTVMVECNGRRSGTVGASSTPTRATLTVSLSERSGRGEATGTGTAVSRNGDFRCDGGSHLVDVFVLARLKPFVKGSAFGRATLKVCTDTCRSVSDARTVRVR